MQWPLGRTLHTSIEQIQTDLDAFMKTSGEGRTNQGKCCLSSAPKQTWNDDYELYKNI